MAHDKSLAAEIEAVLSGRDDERVARILCDVWGYQWDGDPDADENVIPERAGGDYDRPDKETFIAGAVAIRSQVIAPLIAALQSRAFEDGARKNLSDALAAYDAAERELTAAEAVHQDVCRRIGDEPDIGEIMQRVGAEQACMRCSMAKGIVRAHLVAAVRDALAEQEKGDA